MPDTGELKNLRAAITNYESDLITTRAAADQATIQFDDFLKREVASLKARMRPGQVGIMLPPSAEREKLELERDRLLADANQIERNLMQLRRRLEDAQR